MNSEDIEELISQYCYRIGEMPPYDEPSYKELVYRLVNVGVIDLNKAEKFMKIKFMRKEASV